MRCKVCAKLKIYRPCVVELACCSAIPTLQSASPVADDATSHSKRQLNIHTTYRHFIGGDTHTAGIAIAAPLRTLGQQPIQNAALSQTMFVIFIDPFCCNQTSRLRILHYLFTMSVAIAYDAVSPSASFILFHDIVMAL